MELLAFESCSPPRFEVIFQLGSDFSIKLSDLLASSSKFLIIDWIKVTRQSKELNLHIPDLFYTFFFICPILLYVIQMRTGLGWGGGRDEQVEQRG